MSGAGPQNTRAARLRRMMQADAQNILRDPLFAFAALFVLAPAILLSLFAPTLDQAISGALEIDNAARKITPAAILMPAFMVGWMAGFLIVEERDEGVLTALATTPIGADGFLAYRMIGAALLCLILAPISALIMGAELTSSAAAAPGPERSGLQDAARLLLFGVFAGLEAVLIALLLAAFASNKVEALALTKLINLALLAPVLAGLESEWRWLAAPIPSFWAGVLATAATPSGFLLSAGAGLAVHLGAIALALRALRQRPGAR